MIPSGYVRVMVGRDVTQHSAPMAGDPTFGPILVFGLWQMRWLKEEEMYARILDLKIRPGTADELTRNVEQTTVPFLRTLKGFHGVHMIQVSDTEVVSFETWNNKESADASRQAVEQHIQQQLGHLLTASPSLSQGQLVVHGAGHEPHHHPGLHTAR